MQIFLFLKQTFSESLNFFFFFNTSLWVIRNFAAYFTKRCNMEEINERKEETGTGQQYAELLCDFMFKRLFGSEGMYLLKHIHEMESMPEVFRDQLFTRLFMLAKINNFTAQEYEQYKKSLENMSELDNIINSTAELAEIRGHKAGRAEGRAETIAQMLAGGIPEKTVAEALGITVEECRSYRKEQVL